MSVTTKAHPLFKIKTDHAETVDQFGRKWKKMFLFDEKLLI
jgi:hypothetical protein